MNNDFDPTTIGATAVQSDNSFDPASIGAVPAAPQKSALQTVGDVGGNIIRSLGQPFVDLAAIPVQALAKATNQPDPYANGAMGGYNVSPVDKPLQKAGSAVQAALTLPLGPEGAIASTFGKGVIGRTMQALSIPAQGYGWDIGSNLQEGKTGTDALSPGWGTGLSIVAPPIIKAGISATNALFPSAETLSKAIVESYNKGVKPSIAGLNNITLVNKAKDSILNAVSSITKNAPNLKFTNDLGEELIGVTPKTVQQLQEAVDQTKSSIFSQYDALAQQAGDAGVKVNLKPIAGQLDSIINNKALKLTNPEATAYAQSIKDRFIKEGSLDASTAQDVIKNYNDSLKAFYRNPSYETASKAGIDAMLANNVRVALDKGISGLTGESYQALKNQYGALSAIEKDVVKAHLRASRQNAKGLLDFTDVFTGADLAKGLLTFNPGEIARGVTGRVIKETYKYMNSPDKAISNMFKKSKKLEDLVSKTPKPASAGPTMKALPEPAPGSPQFTNSVPINLPQESATTIGKRELANFGKKYEKAPVMANEPLGLPAPKPGAPNSQNNVPINVTPTSAKDISRGFKDSRSLKGFMTPGTMLGASAASTAGLGIANSTKQSTLPSDINIPTPKTDPKLLKKATDAGSPDEYAESIVRAADHTGFTPEQIVKHLTAENGGKWDPKLKGRADPTDKGISQLNPVAIKTITGEGGGRNYFKDNWGHELDPNNGNDQILAAATYLNWLKQFGLPKAGMKDPSDKAVFTAYNTGAKGYVESQQPDATSSRKNRARGYEDLLKSKGMNLTK